MAEKLYGFPVEIAVEDDLYYVSREDGGNFSTRPYLMHTALYYAFRIFPTQFRNKVQNPHYEEDRDDGPEIYIHPAQSSEVTGYEKRRFSVKPDSYRSEAKQENQNLMKTGHQKTIRPGSSFQTFITSKSRKKLSEQKEKLPDYIRIGKKMSSARIQSGEIMEAEIEEGSFSMDIPVSTKDLDFEEKYSVKGDLNWENMNPVDLLTDGKLQGPHADFESTENDSTISVPAETGFLKN